MNTWIWGPPTWKILHTLSFSPRVHAGNAGDIAAFLMTLQDVLPCVYCRASFGTFVQNLHARFGRTLRDVIAGGQLAEWMYALHELVNNKLNQQALAQTDAVAQMQTLRQISFECLTKRFSISPVAFCAADVWDVLKIFALNMDNNNQRRRGRGGRVAAWFLFLSLLPDMIHVCYGDGERALVEALRDCHRTCVELHERRRSASASSSSASSSAAPPNIIDTYFYCVVACWRRARGDGDGDGDASIVEQRKLYSKAEAHSCVDGSCK